MKIRICLVLLLLASSALAQKTFTFSDFEGNPHENVQIVSVDADTITINDHGSITSILYTNIRPADLESMGVPQEKVEMSSRAQRERESAIAAERAATRAATRKIVWNTSVTLVIIVTVAASGTVITKQKAKKLRDRTSWLERKYEEVVRQNGSFDDAAADALSKQAIIAGGVRLPEVRGQKTRQNES